MSVIPESELVETRIRRHAKAYRYLVMAPTAIPAGPETRKICSSPDQATHISLYFSNNAEEEDVHVVDLPDTRGVKRILRFAGALNPDLLLVTHQEPLSKNHDDRLLKA